MGLATAILPVGGVGTGQMGLATATLPVGGVGTGQMGLATATLPVGGVGTGQMGLVTFPCPGKLAAVFGLAPAKVTEKVMRAIKTTMRRFKKDDFIGFVPLLVLMDRNEKSTPE